MFLVVPTKETLRKSTTVLNAPEAVRELRTIFHGAELTLRIWIVVGDVRPAVRLGDAQVGQQEGHRLRTHRSAAIGMQRELAALNVLFRATLLDQTLGQLRALPHGHHPAGDIAAENIEDHVEVKVSPFRRAQELGDVPAPKLIGSGRQQFWFLIWRMGELVATFPGLAPLCQQAVHGAGSSSGTALRRARSRKPRQASDPESVLRGDGPEPPCVPPDPGRVSVKAAEWW